MLSLCGLLIGCGSAGDTAGENAVGQAEQAIYYAGTWSTGVSSSVTGFSDSPNPALEVCMMTMEDGTQQCGKVYPDRNGTPTCRAEYGGHADESASYKLLLDDGRYAWKDAVNGLPGNAVIGDIGGAQPYPNNNQHVYVCQAVQNGFWHPGKWWQGACRIEYADKGNTIQTYGRPNSIYILTHP